MNILIITPGYPDRYKSYFPFVKQLVDEFAHQNHQCIVIAPYSITTNKRIYRSKEQDGHVIVYRPNYLSFSNLKVGMVRITDYFRRKAVCKAIKWLPVRPDVVYCHFWECALDGYTYAKLNEIPLFVASGESSISTISNPNTIPQSVRDYVSGVVCVSSKNKEESILLGLAKPEQCIVLPNAVNTEIFNNHNRAMCRKMLGFPENDFIVAFVGWFTERKGPMRVAEAIRRVGNVKSIFIGKGDQNPQCDGILFKGPLTHDKVPVYLCAADCFVLPTLAEGCSNAVVEAMACGLPIISSNLSFNWDVLDESNSILVDPQNIDEISEAISILRDDKDKRDKLSEGALRRARSLNINNRAERVISFIRERIQ